MQYCGVANSWQLRFLRMYFHIPKTLKREKDWYDDAQEEKTVCAYYGFLS
jgi:hypothetical protein